ncbi:MAG TPA: transaldolase family protein [bacterium]
MKTRIFLDGGDPAETRDLLGRLGFLDGQTTNPTLIARNPAARARLDRGERLPEAEVLAFYRGVVHEISGLLPAGSVSVEVYADPATGPERMLEQAAEMYPWIPNAHIKFPSNAAGLAAAETAAAAGMRVNMTLCFSQEQAAATYAATRGAARGQVFVSPFVGRLDDRGEDGMDLIANILRMYRAGDGHVEVLTASVRTLDHLLFALALGSDIVTAPYKILREWADRGVPQPGADYRYPRGTLRPIPYKELDLALPWRQFDVAHDLTAQGMEKFSADWNALIR